MTTVEKPALVDYSNDNCHLVQAFDTETYNGFVKVLACNDGSFIETQNTLKLLDYLYEKGQKAKYNVFYNIDYDIGVILKTFIMQNSKAFKSKHLLFMKKRREMTKALAEMDLEKAKRLQTEMKRMESLDQFKIGIYNIKIISGKSFMISTGRGMPKVSFFDCSNFYKVKSIPISLEKACKQYLGFGKVDKELNIDRKAIGEQEGYYESNRINIIHYCVLDCVLTKMLFEKTIKGVCNIGAKLKEKYPVLFPVQITMPDNPYTTASIHKQFMQKIELKNPYAEFPSAVKSFIRASYRGGIFDTPVRGMFENVVDMDINSGYPFTMSRLPSIENAEIIKYGKADFETCHYKFYRVKRKLTPALGAKLKTETRIMYVYSKDMHEDFITELDKQILDMYGVEYEILDGIGIKCPDVDKKPFAYIKACFEYKNDVKKIFGKNSVEYTLIKVFMNGGYGVLAQSRPKESALSNFVYASYITAETRFKIKEIQFLIEKAGGEMLSLDTDGIVWQAQNPDVIIESIKSYLDKEQLGMFTLERLDKIVFFMSGVSVRIHKGEKELRNRGFKGLSVDMLEQCETFKFDLSFNKGYKRKSSIIQQVTDKIGTFFMDEKEFNAEKTQRSFYEIPSDTSMPIKDYFIRSEKLKYLFI